jgi:hypothetical protein
MRPSHNKSGHCLIGVARFGVARVDLMGLLAARALVTADLSTFVGTGVVSPARSAALSVALLLTATAGDRGCDTAWVESLLPLCGLAL